MQANKVVDLDTLAYPVVGQTFQDCEFITSEAFAVIQLEGVCTDFRYNYLGFDGTPDISYRGPSKKVFIDCKFRENRFKNIYVNT